MMNGKVEEVMQEFMIDRHKLGRRITNERRVKARSAKQIWKWLKFLVSKCSGLMKYLKCDQTMVAARGWRPCPILARIEKLDIKGVKTKVVDATGVESARSGDASGRRELHAAAAEEIIVDEESTLVLTPRRSRRRWIRRITIRVNRKRPQKRGVMEIESESRRARLTRKRRRVARGWVRHQCDFSGTKGGETSAAAGGAADFGRLRDGGNSSSGGRSAPDPVYTSTTRPPEGYPSNSMTLVKHSSQSRGQKSAPVDETVERLLPDELVEKVLAWIPITSALRFRAVCKRWHYILSPEGYRKMFDKPPAWEACPSFFSSGSKRECAFFDERANKWSTIDLNYLPRPACRLLAASGGLLCLCFAGVCSRVYICNPATKSWRELPEFHHTRRRAGTMLVHLLVDKVTLSYKVIVIGHLSCLSAEAAAASSLTEVYDSRTDEWTALANIPSSGCILAPSIAFRNGILYCLTEHPAGLLAFNIARKVWRRLELKSHSRVLCILEHNGRILIVARLTARVTRLGIWRLRETFPRVWIKVALMPVEHALYFLLSGKFQCFAQGNFICFASPCRPRWLLFDMTKRLWQWGAPARFLDADNYNKWFYYEPRLDISA